MKQRKLKTDIELIREIEKAEEIAIINDYGGKPSTDDDIRDELSLMESFHIAQKYNNF